MKRVLCLLLMAGISFVVVYGADSWFQMRERCEGLETEIHLLHFEIDQLRREKMRLIDYLDEMSNERGRR